MKTNKYTPHKDIQDILWMARRYADGRQTYAPSMFNDAYDSLKQGGYVIDEKVDSVVKTYPYAQYGDGTHQTDERYPGSIPRRFVAVDEALDHWIKKIEDGETLDLLPKKDLHTFLLGLRERLKNQ